MLQPTAPADDPTTPDPNAGNSHTAAPDSMSLQSSQTAVHQSLVGAAPAYLSDDCRLLSDVGRRPLRSNSNDMLKLLVPRTHNKLGDKSLSDDGHRLWTTAAGTYLRRLQTIYENSFIWRPKRLVTLLDV